LNKYYPNSYQTPNALIDVLLKNGTIDSYEFTILSIIIRKTRGWEKDVDAISLNQFLTLAPKMGRTTLIDRLQKLDQAKLITINRRNHLKGKATNRYELGELFFKKGSSPDELEGSSPDELGSSPDEHTKPTTTKPTIQNPLQQNPLMGAAAPDAAVVLENEKSDTAIAALKNEIGHDNPERLIKNFGTPRVQMEIERCRHAMKTSRWIKTTPAQWIEASLRSPGGYNIPEGFISSIAQAEKAEAEARVEEEKDLEAKDFEGERKIREARQKIFETLLSEKQEEILTVAVKRFEKEATEFETQHFEKLVKKHGKNAAVSQHIPVRMIRDELLEELVDERISDAPP